jgi:DNA-binding MarR family transcriptional regulator
MAAEAAQGASRGQRAAISAQDKLQWLLLVTLDKRASSALRVATLLATKYLNRESGEAWPALETIAQDLGVDRKTASRAVDRLVSLVYLSKEPGGGRRCSNRYRLSFSNRKETKVGDKTGIILVEKQGQECPTNPLEEPLEGTQETCGRAGTSFEAFERAWQWEPADSRAAARKSFERLDDKERAKAVQCVSAYFADCVRNRRKQCFAKNYLAERKWEGFGARVMSETGQTRTVYVYKDTPQWRAWREFRGKALPTKEISVGSGRFREGWYCQSEWPPGMEPHNRDKEGGGR